MSFGNTFRRSLRFLLLSAALTACVGVSAQKRKPVDIKSKRMHPVPVADSTAYALVGDVIVHHNGSVITCDSLVRYDARHMTCFGNVIINKETTYVYGDRAEYNGNTNEARVYSPLIKVRDKDALLYTYNFIFNTKTNVGMYYGGGTFTQRDNTIESEKGYYYSDRDELVGVNRVQVKNDTYQMKSDSVSYNTETEIAKYFTRSVLWNKDGDILSSDNGEYHNKGEHYIFRSHAYALSGDREIWADTLDYKSLVKQIEMRHNGQVRDREHNSIIFGNYGTYDDNKGDAFFTGNPVVVSFDTENNDTVYMRSDSMFLYQVDSLGYCTLTRPDSAAMATAALKPREPEKNDEELLAPPAPHRDVPPADSLAVPLADTLRTDTLAAKTDAIHADTLATKADTVRDDRVNRVLLGLRNVKIYRSDFQGVCDSMLVFTADSTAQLHKHSIMWNELNQIVSERADVYTKNQKPLRVIFTERPLMSSEVDSTRYDQVSGKTVEALFNDGVMYRTNVAGNARTLYYMVDDADGSIIGFLVAESADTSFDIEDNKVVGITYRVDPVYTIYPMDQIPAEQSERLPDFVWYIELRPTREQIMGKWVIKPSEREKYETMSRPLFPLTYSIERYKESLVSSGSWADRNDGLPDEALDFLRKIQTRGYVK